MELSVISDGLTTMASTPGLGLGQGLSKLVNNRHRNNFMDQSSGFLQISAVIFPIDAVAPPPVKSSHIKTLPRRLMKKRHRTRRKSVTGGDDNGDGDAEEVFGFFGDGGDNGGPFNNNGGGGSGGSWNLGGFGGANWEDFSSNSSYYDPAFDFVYEVLSWIVLSNCLHFAFKKVVRIVADGFGEPGREKVPMRLTPVC